MGNFDKRDGDADAVLCCGSQALNGALTVAADMVSRSLLDVGGDDDVLGHRVNMSLPYPGVPLKAKVPEDGSLFGLVAPARRQRQRGSRGGYGARASSAEDRMTLLRENSAAAIMRAVGAVRDIGGSRFSGISGDSEGLASYSDFMRQVIASARTVAIKNMRKARKKEQRRAFSREASIDFSFSQSSNEYGNGPSSVHSLTPGGGQRGFEMQPGVHSRETQRRKQQRPGAARSGGYDGSDDESEDSLDFSGDSGSSSSSEDSDGSDASGSSGSSGGSTSSSNSRRSARRRKRNAFRRKGGEAAQPASQGMFWIAGITLLSIWSSGSYNSSFLSRALLCIRRFAFACGRLLRRTNPPLAPTSTALFYAATTLHGLLLLVEVSLTIVCVAVLWCIEPRSDIATAVIIPLDLENGLNNGLNSTSSLGADIPDILVIGECSYTALLIYLAAPPLTCILPPLLGLVALATQSSRSFRMYAEWNGFSIWSTLVALVVLGINIQQVGPSALLIPFGLLGAKLLSAQLVPLQLATVEAARPVRGWRGLFEVRTGPAEKARRWEGNER